MKSVNENKTVNYKIMMGVLPRYSHENEELDSKMAFELGIGVIKDRMPNELKNGIIDINVAKAVYSRNFGCPVGGELGIELSGSINREAEKEVLINTVKEMMGDLGQNTVTIEWEENEKSMGSTYISDGGKNVTHNDSKENLEHFSVKFPAENVDFSALGKRIQFVMEKVNGYDPKKSGKPLYMISGILTEKFDENNRMYYEYSATQNPEYGQVDKDIYQKSVILNIALVTEGLGNVAVEFNDMSVIVENEEHIREYDVLERYRDESEYKGDVTSTRDRDEEFTLRRKRELEEKEYEGEVTSTRDEEFTLRRKRELEKKEYEREIRLKDRNKKDGTIDFVR